MNCRRVLVVWATCLLLPVVTRAQDKPLERAFTAGDTQRYRVLLIVRSEMQGQRPNKIGVNTYAEPFRHKAEANLSWRATRRVVSVSADGAAEIEEALDEFSMVVEGDAPAEATDARKMRAVMNEALSRWAAARAPAQVLRYRESRLGQLSGLKQDGAPVLDGEPPLLTLWLLRALRPTVALPDRPFVLGDCWQEPRTAQIPPWANAQGTEAGEWLDAANPSFSVVGLVNLHVVQQISATVPAALDSSAPPGAGRFHAESLTAVVHLGTPMYGGYGQIYSATRSAVREVTRVLDPIAGLAEPPRFRSNTSVQVQIEILQ